MHILLSEGTISKLPIQGMPPTYARVVGTNNMVHVTRSHATYVPTTESILSELQKSLADKQQRKKQMSNKSLSKPEEKRLSNNSRD